MRIFDLNFKFEVSQKELIDYKILAEANKKQLEKSVANHK